MRPLISYLVIASAFLCGLSAQAQGRLHRLVAVAGMPSPGLPVGETLIGFRLPQIDGDGRVAFRASSENPSGDRTAAIYRETDAGLELVAAEGALLDDGFELTLASFVFTDRTPSRRFPQLTASGFMAFPGVGSSIFPDIPQGFGIWRYHPDGTLERVMLEGEALPGTGLFAAPDIRAISIIDGGTSESLFQITESGDMLIRVDLDGSGVNQLNSIALVVADADGSDLRIVARERDPIPGRPGEEMSEPGGRLLEDGTVIVVGQIRGQSTGGVETRRRIIRIDPDGTRQLLFAQDEPLPGFPPGITLGVLRVDINSTGEIVLEGKLEGPGITPDTASAIFVMRGGQPLQLVYRAAMQLAGMPAGAFYTGFGDARINDAGTIGFVAGVRETATSPGFTAYFSEEGEATINPVVTLGEQAPGFEPGITIGGFRWSFSSESKTPRPRLTPIGMPAFSGPIDDGTNDLEPPVRDFTASPSGRAIRPLDTGTELDTPFGTRVITNSSFDVEGAVNEAGQIAAIAFLDDTTEGIAVASFRDDCLADTNNDGMLTPFDFNAWVIAFNTQSPACDQNGDGLCTPFDFNAWIINYNAGCP